MTRPSGDGRASRRAFLGLGAAALATGISAAAVAAANGDHPAQPAAGPRSVAPRGPRGVRAVAENSRPGDPRWEIRHIGAPGAIEGYAGGASVLTGESFPLFVSTTMNVLRAFADGPAAARYPAHDNLDVMHEYAGDPIGNPAALQ